MFFQETVHLSVPHNILLVVFREWSKWNQYSLSVAKEKECLLTGLLAKYLIVSLEILQLNIVCQ